MQSLCADVRVCVAQVWGAAVHERHQGHHQDDVPHHVVPVQPDSPQDGAERAQAQLHGHRPRHLLPQMCAHTAKIDS